MVSCHGRSRHFMMVDAGVTSLSTLFVDRLKATRITFIQFKNVKSLVSSWSLMLVFVLNQHGYKCRSIQTYNSVSGSNRLCSRSYSLHCMKHYLLFAFSIHQKPIGSSSVTEVHISSAFDEKKMIFHLLNIQKDNKIQPFSFCQNKKVIFHLSWLTKVYRKITFHLLSMLTDQLPSLMKCKS
jgi:hypothetical protein